MTDKGMTSSIQDKLSTVKYRCDNTPHLCADQECCVKCETRDCTFVCPAKVWGVNEENNESTCEYENCLECGACRISCPYGTIAWQYPKAGYGIIYKQS